MQDSRLPNQRGCLGSLACVTAIRQGLRFFAFRESVVPVMLEKCLTILAGAVLGVLCKYICDALVGALMSKREREYMPSAKESRAFFIIMGAFGALIAAFVPLSPETVFMFLILVVCEAVAVIDAHARLIPNELVLAILGLSVLFGVPGLFGLKGWPVWRPVPALIGLAVCFVVFTLPAVMSRQVGAGDIKLAAAMGFCMGLWNSLLAIGLMGFLVLIYSVLQSKAPILHFMMRKVPLGPFLSGAMLIVLLARKLPALDGIMSSLPF